MKRINLFLILFIWGQNLYSQNWEAFSKESINELLLNSQKKSVFYEQELKAIKYFTSVFNIDSMYAIAFVYNFNIDNDLDNNLIISLDSNSISQLILFDSTFKRKVTIYPCYPREKRNNAISFPENRFPKYPKTHPDYPNGRMIPFVSEKRCTQSVFPESYFSSIEPQDKIRFYTTSFGGKYGVIDAKTKKISFQVEGTYALDFETYIKSLNREELLKLINTKRKENCMCYWANPPASICK